eukprot:158193-Prymnesium_polylepis.1
MGRALLKSTVGASTSRRAEEAGRSLGAESLLAFPSRLAYRSLNWHASGQRSWWRMIPFAAAWTSLSSTLCQLLEYPSFQYCTSMPRFLRHCENFGHATCTAAEPRAVATGACVSSPSSMSTSSAPVLGPWMIEPCAPCGPAVVWCSRTRNSYASYASRSSTTSTRFGLSSWSTRSITGSHSLPSPATLHSTAMKSAAAHAGTSGRMSLREVHVAGGLTSARSCRR